MANNRWYYLTKGQTLGPITEEQLRNYASAGRLQPSDFVWCEGMSDWQRASQVPGLFAGPSAGAVMQPVQAETQPAVLNYAPAQAIGLHYAGFWRRVGAALLDGVIVVVASEGIEAVLTAPVGRSSHGILSVLAAVISFAGKWLYFAMMESSVHQATLGKMLLGMRVMDLYGQRLSFGRATGRYFGKILSTLLLGIGYLMVAFTERKQGLHDMLAGTLVVKRS